MKRMVSNSTVCFLLVLYLVGMSAAQTFEEYRLMFDKDYDESEIEMRQAIYEERMKKMEEL